MNEPRPQKTFLPPNSASEMLRVGIVLPEDGLQTLCCLCRDSFLLQIGSENISLAPGEVFEIFADFPPGESRLAVRHGEKSYFQQGTVDQGANAVRVISSGAPLQLMTGLEVQGVPVGRGFHWQKRTVQILPGSFEVHLLNGALHLINILDFEDYVACVASSEMSGDCPVEYCKAQMIAARSWARVFLQDKHRGALFAVCNDDDCQRYQGVTNLKLRVIEAARECRGQYLLANDKSLCPAYYSKCCGGYRESAEFAFGFAVEGLGVGFDCLPRADTLAVLSEEQNFAGFLGDADLGSKAHCAATGYSAAEVFRYLGKVDVAGSYYRWSYEISAQDLCRNLQAKFDLSDVAEITNIVLGKRGISGRVCSLDLQYLSSAGKRQELSLASQYEIRRALHQSFLYSSAFVLQVERNSQGKVSRLKFQGAGWGHGVGMCQIGALVMALRGSGYREILEHYFPGYGVLSV